MKTGFKDLDKILNVNNGELIVVASRPAMGKSTFVQNILSNVAIKENKGVLYFNLEETKEKVTNNLIISNSMVKRDKFKIYNENKKQRKQIAELPEEDWDRIEYGIHLLKNASIYIACDAPYTIDDICKKSMELKKDKDIRIIIIDYLQLIQFDKMKLLSRDNEITEILRKLKVLAKELKVPIIVTSQLSQECEKRENKKPYVADFKNSENGIITYSDKIIFLYRNSYYNKSNKSNITDIIVAKNNDGITNTIKLVWMPEYCKFGNTMIIKEENGDE